MGIIARIFVGPALALASTLALAISPVVPEAFVCGQSHLFIGKVVAAASRDCRLQYVRCSPKDRVALTVVVDKVIAVRAKLPSSPDIDRFGAGQAYEFETWVYGAVPGAAGIGWMPENETVITDAAVRQVFVGKQFVFLLRLITETGGPDHSPYSVAVWPVSQEAFVSEAIAKPWPWTCPVPRV